MWSYKNTLVFADASKTCDFFKMLKEDDSKDYLNWYVNIRSIFTGESTNVSRTSYIASWRLPFSIVNHVKVDEILSSSRLTKQGIKCGKEEDLTTFAFVGVAEM